MDNRRTRKSVKTFLKDLRNLVEQGFVSDLKGAEKLSNEELSKISTCVAALQNEMSDLDEIYIKLKMDPYNPN
jgi:hypothetical protein